jgi:hypothetical protein
LRSTVETLWFVTGMLICGMATFSFAWEYFHPSL